MKYKLLPIGLLLISQCYLRADYEDIVDYFASINTNTIFPVDTLDYDAIESAFGPRIQSSTDIYDFHRGIDIDANGTNAGDLSVVAPIAGVFYDYRTSASGGNIIIMEHNFPAPINYAGKSLSKFYTWYLHLYDDGIADNGIGTNDLLSGYTKGDVIPQGTVIGYMGDTGAPAAGGSYAVHLHWELRVGSTSSLEFQLDNIGSTTQWGFDPHMNPMLLLEPHEYEGLGEDSYRQTLALEAGGSLGNDITVSYQIDNDEMPLLNRIEVSIVEKGTENIATSHTLDYNQRTGFDATSTASLDTQDTNVPYIDPQSYGDTAIAFATYIQIPASWTQPYDNETYETIVKVTDLWGNIVSLTVVPESAYTTAGLSVFIFFAMLVFRKQEQRV